MIGLYSFFVTVTFFYCFLILFYSWGWHKIKTWQLSNHHTYQTSVCIVIPARNESQHISACLQSILQQNFPTHLIKITVIDDHSTDNTAEIVEKIREQHTQIDLISLAKVLPKNKFITAYKKKALSIAIQQTQQELIITTDADCVMKKNWLANIVGFYEKKRAKFITAPVCFFKEKSFIERFQTLDFLGMMVVTGTSVQYGLSNMCNGANLAYPKAVFEEVGGFEGIDHIASGDDMLLMHKIKKKYPKEVFFLKSSEAIVQTYAQPTWTDFINQRIRWGSKTKYYSDIKIILLLAGVLLFYLSLFVSSFGTLIGIKSLQYLFIFQIVSKLIVDFVFLRTACLFFQRNELLWLFLPSQLLHIFYIVIAGIGSNISTYTWKGRKVQ